MSVFFFALFCFLRIKISNLSRSIIKKPSQEKWRLHVNSENYRMIFRKWEFVFNLGIYLRQPVSSAFFLSSAHAHFFPNDVWCQMQLCSSKDVSDLETSMDYFALTRRICFGQTTLAPQFWWLSCLGRKTKIQFFTNSSWKCKIIPT